MKEYHREKENCFIIEWRESGFLRAGRQSETVKR
jgi:hypothetical protein